MSPRESVAPLAENTYLITFLESWVASLYLSVLI